MNYINVKSLSDNQFKRLVGINWSTFQAMLDVLKIDLPTMGRPCKLCIEDQLLLCLSYWREYRTLFHVGMTYGVSETTAHRIVVHIENKLIKSDKFHLPKKLPHGSGIDWDVVVVDATDIEIQRPKKTKEIL